MQQRIDFLKLALRESLQRCKDLEKRLAHQIEDTVKIDVMIKEMEGEIKKQNKC